MSQTDFGALTGAQKKVWSVRIWKAGRDHSQIMATGMIGTDANRPVQLITELTKDERGDQCVMQLAQDLQGDGVVDDQTLEGKEEAITNEDLTIKLSQLRNGVKNKGRMSEQKTVLRFRVLARDRLGYWFAKKLDELAFLTLSGRAYTLKLDGSNRSGSNLPSLAFAADVTAPSTNRKYFCGTATATNTITAADKLTWNDLIAAKAMAVRKLIKPITVKGNNKWFVMLSPEQARDLRQDDDYKQIVSTAGNRGESNPLFTGMMADVDGLLLYECHKVATTRGAASGSKYGSAGTLNGAQALLLGAQALGHARIGDPTWDESDNTDYGNKAGIAHGQIIGFKKPVFKSAEDAMATEDFSVISIYSYAA